MLHNYQYAELGITWISFNSQKIQMDLMSASNQIINCKVRLDGQSFMYAIVCASDDKINRRRLWEMIDQFSYSVEGPWLI